MKIVLLLPARDGGISFQESEHFRLPELIQYLQSIVDTIRDPILVLEANLRVVSANRAFYNTFQTVEQETVDCRIYELGNGQWDIPALRILLEEILLQNSSFDDFEVTHHFPEIGRKVMLLNARKLYRPGNHTEMLLLAIEDVTQRRLMEKERDLLLTQQQQLLALTRIQVEHESIINQTGSAVRSALDAGAIQAAAISILGEGLDVDRCYISRYDIARDQGRISPEWLRPNANIRSLSDFMPRVTPFSINTDPAFQAGATQVVSDVVADLPAGEAATLTDLQVRAFIRVPFEVGNQMTVLAVNMASTSRKWTMEEVRLVENVAVLVRSAMEIAHVQQREHNIAAQLQEALLPNISSDTEALEIASYYRPALKEASVGGDFFDVFNVRKGCTAFVVADLSGKGLAAAKEVATVRNMLRLALYSNETVAEAVTVLHRAIVAHELLSSFCTLFVGVHDADEKTLSYVNCGQEPGLIYRAATGEVEQMPPTGPILGILGTGPYQERIVPLAEGDLFALFTDGLTEVGPTRKRMLEIEGVTNIFHGCCAEMKNLLPEAIVSCLINEVDKAAQGGARDDIALLVCVIQAEKTATQAVL